MNDEENPKKPEIDLRSKVHPVVASMPAHLKDPANYEKIQLALYDAFSGVCGTHIDVLEMAGCAKCQRALQGRAELMRKLGFATPAHYRIWARIHETIKKRVPLTSFKK